MHQFHKSLQWIFSVVDRSCSAFYSLLCLSNEYWKYSIWATYDCVRLPVKTLKTCIANSNCLWFQRLCKVQYLLLHTCRTRYGPALRVQFVPCRALYKQRSQAVRGQIPGRVSAYFFYWCFNFFSFFLTLAWAPNTLFFTLRGAGRKKNRLSRLACCFCCCFAECCPSFAAQDCVALAAVRNGACVTPVFTAPRPTHTSVTATHRSLPKALSSSSFLLLDL